MLSRLLPKLSGEDLAQWAEESHYSSRAIHDLVRPLVIEAVVAFLLFRPSYLCTRGWRWDVQIGRKPLMRLDQGPICCATRLKSQQLC
jgi:hypothetical protein